MDDTSKNSSGSKSEKDQAIIESYHMDYGIYEPDNVIVYTHILHQIAHDEPRMIQDHRYLMERVLTDPGLQQELVDGYRAKSFRLIRQRGKSPPFEEQLFKLIRHFAVELLQTNVAELSHPILRDVPDWDAPWREFYWYSRISCSFF